MSTADLVGLNGYLAEPRCLYEVLCRVYSQASQID